MKIVLNVVLGVSVFTTGALGCFLRCPIIFPTFCPFTYNYCYSNFDCAYGFTCCSIQCGRDCIWNGYLTDGSYSKSCPASNSFSETCETYLDDCKTPDDCAENKVCCVVDTCGRRCLAPEPDSISRSSGAAGPDVRSKSAYIDALLYAAHSPLSFGSKLTQEQEMTKLMGEDWMAEAMKNHGRMPGWEERIKQQMEEQLNGD